MDPDLVGPAGEQMDFQHRPFLVLFQDPVFRHRRPAIGPHGPPVHPFRHPADGMFDSSLRNPPPSFTNRQVFPVDLAVIPGQGVFGESGFGHHQDSGGIPVQPVQRMDAAVLSGPAEIPSHGLDQGIPGARPGGMDQHPCRLVHHQQILIFIQNGKGQMDGDHRRFFFPVENKPVPGFQPVRRTGNRGSVYGDGAIPFDFAPEFFRKVHGPPGCLAYTASGMVPVHLVAQFHISRTAEIS